jgi:hypothetical protein
MTANALTKTLALGAITGMRSMSGPATVATSHHGAMKHVVAVGHLLLRENRHSRDGLMRANVDLKALRLDNFDRSQASAIRAMLLQPAVGPTEGNESSGQR